MFGLELLVAGVLGVTGHFKSRDFVHRRLRYTSLVEKPGLGLAAGVATAVIAAPLVAIIPFIGVPTAIALGAGVGTGVAMGAARARHGAFEKE